MTKPWDKLDPIWRWLGLEWQGEMPISSYAMTNVDFLKGGRITEVMRWELGYWEMFAGPQPNVLDKDVRFLLISTFIGADPSLDVVLNLIEGDGIWRDAEDLKWNNWE